jgi:HTH-type transcriptional regulator / antitoxin HigA
VAIRREEEYRRLLAAALMEKPGNEISEDQGRPWNCSAFSSRNTKIGRIRFRRPKPHKMLAYLLKEKDMKPSDLWSVLPKSRVSEILNGKRGISKAQARQLAELCHVPVDLFV